MAARDDILDILITTLRDAEDDDEDGLDLTLGFGLPMEAPRNGHMAVWYLGQSEPDQTLGVAIPKDRWRVQVYYNPKDYKQGREHLERTLWDVGRYLQAEVRANFHLNDRLVQQVTNVEVSPLEAGFVYVAEVHLRRIVGFDVEITDMVEDALTA